MFSKLRPVGGTRRGVTERFPERRFRGAGRAGLSSGRFVKVERKSLRAWIRLSLSQGENKPKRNQRGIPRSADSARNDGGISSLGATYTAKAAASRRTPY